MNYKPRIFISCIYKLEKDSPQKKIKDEIIKRVRNAGFEPQIFLEEGLAKDIPWNFNSVYEVMKKCDGVIILGLSRWVAEIGDRISGIATEYNQFEGALAGTLKLPVMVIYEQGIPERGIFFTGGGYNYAPIPPNADENWFNTDEHFVGRFNSWIRTVNNRFQVFLGYSGGAKDTANAVITFLTNRLKLKVKEYRTNFLKGGTILEEIENASYSCQCGIFLFTADDPLLNNEQQASPRDNVIFEAGYFMRAKGKERILIILEEGAKMPADIGANIYLPLKNRNDISTIQAEIEYFLETRL